MRVADAEETGNSPHTTNNRVREVADRRNGHRREEEGVAFSAADDVNVESLVRTSQRRTMYYHNAARLVMVSLLSVFVAIGLILSTRTRLDSIGNGGGGVTTSPKAQQQRAHEGGNGTTASASATATVTAMDEIEVFDLVADVAEPTHMSPIDPKASLKPHAPDPILPIDDAHRLGLIHVGAWVLVTSSDSKLLLLRRGPDLVTCPNSWMPLGEHALPDDDGSPSANALRGVREELGPAVLRDHLVFDANLTSLPVYYIRDYGPGNGGRIDRQVTYLWHIGLNATSDRLDKGGGILNVDDEVDALDWFTVPEVEEWMKDRPEDFCHETIRGMLSVGLEALKDAEVGGRWGGGDRDDAE